MAEIVGAAVAVQAAAALAWAGISPYVGAAMAMAPLLSTMGSATLATAGSAVATTAAPAITAAAGGVATTVAAPVIAAVGGTAALIALTKYAVNNGLKFYAVSKIGHGVGLMYVDEAVVFGMSTGGIIGIAVAGIAFAATPSLVQFLFNLWRGRRPAQDA